MRRIVGLLCCVAMVLVVGLEAKIKVRAEPDPDFDFATVKTWAWDADAGDVMMARTQSDDPAALKARVDPMVRRYVESEMTKKGLKVAPAGTTPNVFLHYYVLVTISATGQYAGQFLPAVPYWGLPPFNPGTTALDVATKGSLILDALLPGAAGERKVVWRGLAESTVADDDPQPKREARMREAVAELVKRFPLTKKKK
jgi:hypothetical protein